MKSFLPLLILFGLSFVLTVEVNAQVPDNLRVELDKTIRELEIAKTEIAKLSGDTAELHHQLELMKAERENLMRDKNYYYAQYTTLKQEIDNARILVENAEKEAAALRVMIAKQDSIINEKNQQIIQLQSKENAGNDKAALVDTAIAPKIRYWNKRGLLWNTNFTNSAYSNWIGGGVNSIAVNSLFYGFALHEGKIFAWDNYLELGIGGIKQNGINMRKTDDRMIFTTKMSFKETETIRYTAMVDFRTQFLDGYNYPSTDSDSGRTVISSFFAPAYAQASLGIEWKPSKVFYLFYSPIASKFTFVMNDTLSAAGAFGVTPGERVRSELLGTSLNAKLVLDNVVKNVTFTSSLNLFSNYVYNLEHHFAVDVFWDNLLSLKVNKFITASYTTSLIYDEDVKFAVVENNVAKNVPKVQFKQVMAIGVTIQLGDLRENAVMK